VTAYPPYTGDDARCTKCGGHGAGTEYVGNFFELSYGDVYRSPGSTDEVFVRECYRCSYKWVEAVPAEAA